MLTAYLMEWGSQLLRWLHVITAIAWIGSSFFFIHLDADCLDDTVMPAVDFRLPGGLSHQELQTALRIASTAKRLVSFVTNPRGATDSASHCSIVLTL